MVDSEVHMKKSVDIKQHILKYAWILKYTSVHSKYFTILDPILL